VYLLWLGISTARNWRAASFSSGGTDNPPRTTGRVATFFRGMGTSGINPKGLLLYVALVPQFVSPQASLPASVQSGILGLSFVAAAALVYTLVALASRKLLASRPAAAGRVTLASGTIMIVLGAALLWEQAGPLLAFFA
jgi:threonine/homoserine/homoserine lactone efflux protein